MTTLGLITTSGLRRLRGIGISSMWFGYFCLFAFIGWAVRQLPAWPTLARQWSNPNPTISPKFRHWLWACDVNAHGVVKGHSSTDFLLLGNAARNVIST
jgi:hypothetical protein